MDTLKALDIVVVVYVTDHIDISTVHIYGNSLPDLDIRLAALKCVEANHPQGEDAMGGWEILSILR